MNATKKLLKHLLYIFLILLFYGCGSNVTEPKTKNITKAVEVPDSVLVKPKLWKIKKKKIDTTISSVVHPIDTGIDLSFKPLFIDTIK